METVSPRTKGARRSSVLKGFTDALESTRDREEMLGGIAAERYALFAPEMADPSHREAVQAQLRLLIQRDPVFAEAGIVHFTVPSEVRATVDQFIDRWCLPIDAIEDILEAAAFDPPHLVPQPSHERPEKQFTRVLSVPEITVIHDPTQIAPRMWRAFAQAGR